MSTTSTEEPTHKKANGPENTTTAEIERVSRALSERIEEHDENRAILQERLHEACEKLKKEIDDLECRINNELREKFTAEDSRLQTALIDLQTAMSSKTEDKVFAAFQKAKAELLVVQKYDLKENPDAANISGKLELMTNKDISAEWFEKPKDLKVTKVNDTGRVFLSYTRNVYQEKVLSESGLEALVSYVALLKKKDCEEDVRKYPLRKDK